MEKRLCKKCGTELPEAQQFKSKLCEECNEKRKSVITKIIVGAGAVCAAAIGATLIAIASKNGEDAQTAIDEYDIDFDDYDEDDCSESLSVWDAADIYASSGFDEDYSFGYTHEELTRALRD